MELITDKKPFVSILISTYNYGHFIEEAIESVLNQTFPKRDMEVIVVDDGSTDDTRERVKKYRDRIRYIYKENGGQASGFNVGFENTRGEIIAFLDSDDYWHPDKLKCVAGEFERDSHVNVVSHYMYLVDDKNKIIGVTPDKIEEKMPFEKYPMENYLKGILPYFPPTSGITVKADCLKRLMPIPTNDFRICADQYLISLLPFYAKEFAYIKKNLGSYRIHGNNYWVSKKQTVQHVSEMVKINTLAFEYVEKIAKGFGYDYSLLKKQVDAMRTEVEIKLYSLQGKRIKALQKAFYFNYPALKSSIGFRIFKKITLVLSVLIPYSKYLWLREKYRNSFIFTIMHR